MGASTLVDLMRHGEPVGGRRYRGQIDDPLSEKGWAQMWAAVGEAAPWQAIVSSPLQRCAAFADALAKRHDLPLHFDPRLMEVGFGAWEGHTADELRQADPEQLTRFYHDPVRHRPPGAEPLADFVARVGQAFADVLATHAGRHVLVVCHAGVIRAVVAQVLQAPLSALYRLQVDSAGLTRIRADAEKPPTLLFHGGRLT